MGFIKTKNIYAWKKIPLEKWNIENEKKIFPKHLSGDDFISRLYKELFGFHNDTLAQLKMGKFSECVSKEEMQKWKSTRYGVRMQTWIVQGCLHEPSYMFQVRKTESAGQDTQAGLSLHTNGLEVEGTADILKTSADVCPPDGSTSLRKEYVYMKTTYSQ